MAEMENLLERDLNLQGFESVSKFSLFTQKLLTNCKHFHDSHGSVKSMKGERLSVIFIFKMIALNIP